MRPEAGATERYVCRTALVTGGASGIGRAVVEALAARGISVFVGDVSWGGPTPPATDGYRLDVSDSSDVKRVFAALRERLENLDLVVNAAAVMGETAFVEDLTDREWKRVMSVNLDGTFFCCREAVRWMKETGQGGRIVNFSSVAGLMPTPGALHYSASKGGVIQLTKTLARETARYDVRVNAIAPGYIETPMLQRLDASFKEQTLQRTPLKRFGTAEEVAALVVFLASPEADFFTGQVLSPNGGLVI
ncbi:MAG: SDR family NAD(P)-dependent oxidoreductase [Candidatus Bipolaricaulota bacterium]